MKPSEYLMGNEWKNKSKHDVFLVRVEYNKMNNFDKQFIDREELYKQVKEILDESLTKACLKAMEDKDFIKIYDKNLRKILELLK